MDNLIADDILEEYRPWGYYKVIEGEKNTFKVKKIIIEPGQKLSYQFHYHRSEYWIVVKGMGKLVFEGEEKFIRPGESVFFKSGQKHRMENPGKIPLVIIEVQVGEYLGEDDIIRLEDEYNRT